MKDCDNRKVHIPGEPAQVPGEGLPDLPKPESKPWPPKEWETGLTDSVVPL